MLNFLLHGRVLTWMRMPPFFNTSHRRLSMNTHFVLYCPCVTTTDSTLGSDACVSASIVGRSETARIRIIDARCRERSAICLTSDWCIVFRVDSVACACHWQVAYAVPRHVVLCESMYNTYAYCIDQMGRSAERNDRRRSACENEGVV